jgi:hypothetical protein
LPDGITRRTADLSKRGHDVRSGDHAGGIKTDVFTPQLRRATPGEIGQYNQVAMSPADDDDYPSRSRL